jgi:hypothetical protein
MPDQAIATRRGGAFLKLTNEQYSKLKSLGAALNARYSSLQMALSRQQLAHIQPSCHHQNPMECLLCRHAACSSANRNEVTVFHPTSAVEARHNRRSQNSRGRLPGH